MWYQFINFFEKGDAVVKHLSTVIGCFVSFVFLFCFVTDVGALDVSKVGVSGNIVTYAKVQDSYHTPLDSPYNVREGANYREEQHFRAKAVINFTYGEPGDQWFGLAQLAIDANDPDNGNSDNSNSSKITFGEDSSAIFAMYRPFEVNGGRPFGIMMGVVPVMATANAAYFNYFLGDIEEDFILYTATGIAHSPGINLDFHISEETGFGLAYVNGVEDGSEIAALMEPDSAENIILWGEAKKWGFGWNGAVQFVKGKGSGEFTLDETTPAGNELMSYDKGKDYSHRLYNSMLTYKHDLGPVSLMPAIGFEMMDGEQCAISALGMPGRDVDMFNMQFGVKVFTRFFDIPGEFSILYTKNSEEDFNAYGQLTSDAGNAAIDAAGVQGAGLTAGWWTTSNPALGPLADAPAIGAAGTSKAVSALAGVDDDLHIEYKLDITKNIQVGLFYYKTNTRTLNPAESFKKVDGTATNTRLTTMLTGAGDPTPEASADALLTGVAAAVAKQFEWTDSQSYGLLCKVSF